MIFIYKTTKFAPVWSTILKIRAIFVHQTVAEHALYGLINYKLLVSEEHSVHGLRTDMAKRGCVSKM